MSHTIKALDRATGRELAALPCPARVRTDGRDVWRLGKQAGRYFREMGALTPAQAACALFTLVEAAPDRPKAG